MFQTSDVLQSISGLQINFALQNTTLSSINKVFLSVRVWIRSQICSFWKAHGVYKRTHVMLMSIYASQYNCNFFGLVYTCTFEKQHMYLSWVGPVVHRIITILGLAIPYIFFSDCYLISLLFLLCFKIGFVLYVTILSHHRKSHLQWQYWSGKLLNKGVCFHSHLFNWWKEKH